MDYRNRKQYQSLNVQVVYDARQRIMSARTGFRGSRHDAFILRQTALYYKFESSQMPSGWLLGDSGYPQLAWLMTPVRYPQSQADHLYNRAHQKTRTIVETTFGLLKSRFMCLAKPGGELLYSPRKAARIILACCVLHNLCMVRNESWKPSEEREPEVRQPPVARRECTEAGLATRAELISRYFTSE